MLRADIAYYKNIKKIPWVEELFFKKMKLSPRI